MIHRAADDPDVPKAADFTWPPEQARSSSLLGRAVLMVRVEETGSSAADPAKARAAAGVPRDGRGVVPAQLIVAQIASSGFAMQDEGLCPAPVRPEPPDQRGASVVESGGAPEP
jgi:hypothetical protein